MTTSAQSPATTAADMKRIGGWKEHHLLTPHTLPFSYALADRRLRGIPPDFHPSVARRRIDANIVETVYEGTDDTTGLTIRVECFEYLDYPVVEWTAWFTNTGTAKTPLLSDILAIDASFEGSAPILHHCSGDRAAEDSYVLEETPLPTGEAIELAPVGGRPCDGAFPYFRIPFDGCGLTVAVGWPGQWWGRFEGLEDGIHIKAGQEKTRLYLLPGESIRTPRMTVMHWAGDVARGINVWRRWHMQHVLPRTDGRVVQPVLTADGPDRARPQDIFENVTEENQLRYIDKTESVGLDFDVWWIDAGWYPCTMENHERRWSAVAGTWMPDPERFPNGLGPVSRRVHESGADFLVWFEPERVTPGSAIAEEHPEWCLSSTTHPHYLLNLSDPEARQWLTDLLCRLIDENGIDVYRQDHNVQPLGYWRENEPDDRQGITENLYVQGFLRNLDEVLERNPGVWIDCVAGAMRRNDLETMRRSVTLQYTDFAFGTPHLKLDYHHTLFAWVPYFRDIATEADVDTVVRTVGQLDPMSPDPDPFTVHCSLALMLTLGIDIRRDDYDWALFREIVDLWRRAADLLYHDYYLLTPHSRSDTKWVVRQFDRPESRDGLIQGIRHSACEEESITVPMKVLHPDSEYRFENPETGDTMLRSGQVLGHSGFSFKLPKRSAAMWFYSLVG